MRQGLLGLIVAIATAPACALAGYQDARLLKRGQFEVTPSYSQVAVSGVAVGETGETETARLVNNFGVQAALGVTESVNVSAGVVRGQTLTGTGDGATGVGLGLSLSLKKDRIALFVPAALAIGPGVDTIQSITLRPTLVFTWPMSSRVDFNPAAYAVFRVCDGCRPGIGGDLGIGVRMGASRWILRPAFGLLRLSSDPGTYWSAGVGLSYRR